MKLIESSAEYIPQDYTYEGIIRHIEKCARVCYKSEDKQSESFENSKKFVKRLIDSGHTAMLEHGTVHINFINTGGALHEAFVIKYEENFYSKNEKSYHFNGPAQDHMLENIENNITTNMRVVVENDWLDDLRFICEPTENHNKRYTFKLVTSIGIVRELLRHRVFSFANESTRYCNYSKDKFDNEITYIIPSWYHGNTPENILEKITDSGQMAYYQALEQCERTYYAMLFSGLQPQQAREVLPLCTKSELIMTGFKSDWDHFFDLRLYGKTGEPHPDMKILAQKIKDEFDKYNL